MHSLETILRINAVRQAELPPYELRLHPKICALRRDIDSLSVSSEYRRWLRYALWRYADQLIEREEPQSGEGWSNIEALQQVVLGDRLEASLTAMSMRIY